MKNELLSVLVCSTILITGCTQQGQKSQSIQNATQSMAKNQSVQRAFSDGRIQVMQQDEQTKRSILQNTIKEQEMMMTDPDLRQRVIGFNAKMNQLMTNDPTGKEQLMVSTLNVMNGINDDRRKHHHLVQIQNESRKKALKDIHLQSKILQQGVNERFLALNNPTTSRSVKELSLKTTDAIHNDKDFKPRKLTQDIQGFKDISTTPSLRSQMADAMIPLLKDPKIADELEKMIKMAVAQATQKMQVQMQQQMKQQMEQQQMEKRKIEKVHQIIKNLKEKLTYNRKIPKNNKMNRGCSCGDLLNLYFLISTIPLLINCQCNYKR
ncbi:hypothetical protein [Aneurinibacillus tyrosinisolvens]|uniref:hypothetical protein n=1 Tax=Aneurinibacillus tyrosinisolvens TaxID=1443435 RepID=UPI00063FBCE1|nr:hypothetical protein [Aneurinibacillus tyrosinisolvens]